MKNGKAFEMTLRYTLFTILLCTVFACQRNTDSGADQVLEEAGKIHLQAVEIDKTVKPLIAQLEQERNQINIQGRALSEGEIQRVQQIESILASYDWFNENHVEVPGLEHDHDHDHDHDHEGHDHDHDHDHDHGPGLELSPNDMLLVQKEFLDTIQSIQKRVDVMLK